MNSLSQSSWDVDSASSMSSSLPLFPGNRNQFGESTSQSCLSAAMMSDAESDAQLESRGCLPQRKPVRR
eukprot:11206585-Lingulodinium_polyedra.AAC.1